MANKILIKKSTVTGKIPLASDLDIGELAINTADARLYTKHSDNSIRLLKAEPILPDVVSVGTYTKVTTDIKGRVVSGTTLSSIDIPLLSISKVDGLQSILDLKSTINSPLFTGTPTAPTPDGSDNSTRIATTEFVVDKLQSYDNYQKWNISDGIGTYQISSNSIINIEGDGINVNFDGDTNTLQLQSVVSENVIDTLEALIDKTNETAAEIEALDAILLTL